ncbi:sulfite exporter TauE/SafE family protein [Cognaticolwellia mytili]|uniref:hypothetical protein n=1 Tax=Cognaticolwellia mytili TaxID=1888913 RepID=UPI001F16A660|nr:hypothetical protein [Cognaticolwellia mytili]
MNLQAKIQSKEQIKEASVIALWSILNLTFLPVLAFIALLLKLNKCNANSLSEYHLKFAIKLNLIAAGALIAVSVLMILLGGFNSGWTWVFVITYFVLVHTIFIVLAVWALIRSWSGNKVFKQ